LTLLFKFSIYAAFLSSRSISPTSNKGFITIQAIEEDETQLKSLQIGTYFLQELEKVRSEFPSIVGDVRGKGLMIGMELVSDPETRAPLPAADILQIWEQCKDLGVLLGKGGLFGNVTLMIFIFL